MKTMGRLWVVLLISIGCSATIAVSSGTNPNSFVLCGKMVTPHGVVAGNLVVQGSAIVCVGPDCTPPADATWYDHRCLDLPRLYRRPQSCCLQRAPQVQADSPLQKSR